MELILERLLQSDLNAHHVISFDNLVCRHIPQIVKMYGTFTTMLENVKYTMKITDVISSPTRSTTTDCHRYGLNFLFCVRGTILLYEEGVDIPIARTDSVPLVYIPMITGRSILNQGLDADPEPFSGLFISKGKCRTIPPSKTVLHNRVILSTKKGVCQLQVRSAHASKIFRSTSTIDMVIDSFGVVKCRLPFQTTPIHLRIIVMALGSTIDDFITCLQRIVGGSRSESRFRPVELSLEQDHPDIQTRDQAIMFISNVFNKNILSTGENIIKNELFPHVTGTLQTKLHYLCLCTARLVLYQAGCSGPTSRDDYSFSQIVSSANHLGSMFRLLFITHVRTCGKLLRRVLAKDKSKLNMEKLYGEPRLSNRVMSAVASGAWSTMRKGVSINLNSNNFDAVESQLRRISSSLTMTSGHHTVPRNVSGDQYGFICAASTPDGESTGLVYELAITASVSPPGDDKSILNMVLQESLAPYMTTVAEWLQQEDEEKTHACYFLIDTTGTWINCVPDSSVFVRQFRGLRRSGAISPFAFIDIEHETRVITITCQEGILCRPLIILENFHSFVDVVWSRIPWLLANGIIEYVSPAEQRSLCCIAVTMDQVTQKTTHVEITQASFLGKMASSVAFATGQQGPRLAYSTLQKKQIVTGRRKRYRGAGESNQLWSTHRPLVRSQTSDLLPESANMCRGVPVVLAMMALPQNQEDAIIVKKSTLDRGAFTMSDNREYTSEITTHTQSTTEKFEKPPDGAISTKTTSYDYIGENGLPERGTKIPGGAVVIGKTRILKRTSICNEDLLSTTKKCDISTCCKQGDDSVVTNVSRTKLPNGTQVRVTLTSTRKPEVGDKFTSQYAQKGVIGAIWNDVDMPFSIQTGVSPDMIVSPLSMTSRMTMSSLLESICGKVVSVTGDYRLGLDKQNYQQSNLLLHKRFAEELKSHGFTPDGTERYIDGRTGEMIKANIFVGVVDYYRLVHIASKKIHARSTGPRDPLTRQPRDGRRFGGGLRIGEMESNALAAHGTSVTLQERFREMSDSFDIYVCGNCQLMCDDVCVEIDYQYCRHCQSNTSIRSVKVPFTFLLLTLELMATGIVTKFHIQQDEHQG